MANNNGLYTKFKEHLLNGDIDISTDPIKVALVKLAYAPTNPNIVTALATHEFFFTHVGANSMKAQTVPAVTVVGGLVDAGDVTVPFGTVPVFPLSNPVEYLIMYVDGTPGSTDYLIGLFDTTVLNPTDLLPYTTLLGQDLLIQWNVSGIFTL